MDIDTLLHSGERTSARTTLVGNLSTLPGLRDGVNAQRGRWLVGPARTRAGRPCNRHHGFPL